jgi:hypothetical protein
MTKLPWFDDPDCVRNTKPMLDVSLWPNYDEQVGELPPARRNAEVARLDESA